MDERLLRKVRDLLKLASRGGTEHEATAAAAAAQRLMETHGIDSAMLDTGDAPAPETVGVAKDPLDVKSSAWKRQLAARLARANRCKLYRIGKELMIIGSPTRCASVRYLYAYLTREIESLAKREAYGHGRAYVHAWRIGCAARVGERVVAASAEARDQGLARAYARGGEGAIVRVSSHLATQEAEERSAAAIHQNIVKGSRAPRGPRVTSRDGYTDGKEAGNRVHLGSGPALGAGGAGQLRGGR